MHKISYFFLGHVLFPLLNCRVPMDRDHVLCKTFCTPVKSRKEANMYKPFPCGKHYSGKEQKDPLGKAGVPRMASFVFTCLASSCLYPHTQKQPCSLSGSFSGLCSPTGDNLVPSPQVISGACCLRVFLLYGLSVVLSLELQVSNFSNSFPMTPLTISKILHALG